MEIESSIECATHDAIAIAFDVVVATTWRIVVDVRIAGVTCRLGEVSCELTGSHARVLAVASCPGATAWFVRAISSDERGEDRRTAPRLVLAPGFSSAAPGVTSIVDPPGMTP